MKTEVKIKENSWLARIAAWKLGCSSVAMVVGKTIHLHNSSRKEFMSNISWLRHEAAHVKQYKELGTARFLYKYLKESFHKGYEKNRFEVEAREREKDCSILADLYFT